MASIVGASAICAVSAAAAAAHSVGVANAAVAVEVAVAAVVRAHKELQVVSSTAQRTNFLPKVSKASLGFELNSKGRVVYPI